MLMPDKHIGFAESLIGLGAFVLESLHSPKDIDAVWKSFEIARGNQYPAFHSFDNLLLTIDMLFAINAITLMDDGKLKKISSGSASIRHALN